MLDESVNTPKLLTVKQFSSEHPVFTEGSLRWMIFQASHQSGGRHRELPIGLRGAFVHFRGKVLIDEAAFFGAIALDNTLHFTANLIKNHLETTRFTENPMDLEEVNGLTMLDAAATYAEWGLKVVLVHGITPSGHCTCGNIDCNSPGKHPVHKNWRHDLHHTKSDINNIFATYPNANVGLLTGPESGLLVLDIDSKVGRPASEVLAKLEQKLGALPTTPRCNTGSGGFHLFFQYPADQEVGNSVGKLAKQVDIRGNGGFVVTAPSRHISGGTYQWAS